MKFQIKGHRLQVTRESTDPRFYGVAGAKGESRFLYHVKLALNRLFPHRDFIKKRMENDGHLVDDLQQYIRTRKGDLCFYNDHWAISGLDEDFNEQGYAMLAMVGNSSDIEKALTGL